ncbi:D-2-hydroxyacid dehydrogenase [Bacillus salitolerans]|uniref:D-2-hydroxyacid dehydrogenase n=1 Tax=Bacillus salitolerans TaxID=1437434 RepID=A0ABW4LJ54_9BACI
MKIITSLRVKTEKQEALKKRFREATFHFYSSMEEAKTRLADADILVTYGEDVTEDLIQSTRQLKWIMVMSAGIDRMPFQAIQEKNIMVTNVRGIHKIPMAEYTLGMILQVSKQAKQLHKQEMDAVWNRSIRMSELYGKTVMIIGIGAIGGQIAKLCKAFGMRVIGINRSGSPASEVDVVCKMEVMAELLPDVDFVVSVLPSTKETRHSLTKEHFVQMKDSAVFINIGRGDVVREDIIIEVMQNNLISHAVLDVFETEPLAQTSPLWKMENVTVTPHISSITANYLPRAFEIFEENLKRFLKKETNYINLIDVNRGY